MGASGSLIRARYAVSILRVAKGAPRQEAIRLVENLSKDWLDMETDGMVADARASATDACAEFVMSLRENSPIAFTAWKRAANAADRWLEVVK